MIADGNFYLGKFTIFEDLVIAIVRRGDKNGYGSHFQTISYVRSDLKG